MPPRWLRLPKTPNPNPSRDLSCGSMCNDEGDFDEHNDRQHRRRRRRSTFIMYEVSRRQEFLWRNPEKKKTARRQRARSSQWPKTKRHQTQCRLGGKGERVSTLGDRKNVITANVSMQFDWSCGPLYSPLAWLAFFLVFLSRSNTKLSVILEIVKGIAQAKSPKALNAIPSIPQWREETCQSDDDDDDDGGGSTLEINTKLKSSWK